MIRLRRLQVRWGLTETVALGNLESEMHEDQRGAYRGLPDNLEDLDRLQLDFQTSEDLTE
jgi:hypothetical protein